MTLEERLEKIEAMLAILVERQQVREWYTVEEFARIVGRAEFTCREWCRHGRINGEKKGSGRGAYASWVVSHEELLRYQREGLIPLHVCRDKDRDSGTEI
jgi:predicted site-specific integrase-resolvase